MSSSPSTNRRSIERRPGVSVGPLRLRAEPAGPPFTAAVWDISILGVGLLAGSNFETGTSLTVQTGPSGQALSSELRALVRHSHKLPDGTWLIGCSFSRHLTTEDVMALG